MVSLLHPPLSFLQIQNKDNGGIALLALPRPWLLQKCFAATAAIAICSNGSRPAMNGKRTRRKESGLYYVYSLCNAPNDELYDLSLCKRFLASVNGKRIGGRGADWSSNITINPCGRGQTNNLPSGLALGQGRGEQGGEVELLLLVI